LSFKVLRGSAFRRKLSGELWNSAVGDCLMNASGFPHKGRAWEDLAAEMEAMKAGDIDWRGGRSPLYVFGSTDEVAQVAQAAFNLYFTENALGAKRAFGSLQRMEAEVLAAALDLMNAPEGAAATFTTGGSESLILSVAAARAHDRQRHGVRSGLNVVAPASAHPGFDKGGRLMDIDVRRVPTGADTRADVGAMADAIDKNTIMLVGSAPCFPHGVVDPIPELSELAVSAGLWLHVDACVGGFMAPFARALGREIPAFDFSCPGVRSISADLHKFGYCPKPASTLMFRDEAARDGSVFDFDDWPNGRFTTATLAGTRPGGAVAGAWAVMNFLGREGYLDLTRRALAMADAYAEGIAAIPHLEMVAKPDLTILNWRSPTRDIFAVAEQMSTRGWLPGLTRKPAGMHLMASLLHEAARPAFLADLGASVDAVGAGPDRGLAVEVRYS
jgi:sphinganine-1-phosphate aldolase